MESKTIQRKMGKLRSVTSELHDIHFYRSDLYIFIMNSYYINFFFARIQKHVGWVLWDVCNDTVCRRIDILPRRYYNTRILDIL